MRDAASVNGDVNLTSSFVHVSRSMLKIGTQLDMTDLIADNADEGKDKKLSKKEKKAQKKQEKKKDKKPKTQEQQLLESFNELTRKYQELAQKTTELSDLRVIMAFLLTLGLVQVATGFWGFATVFSEAAWHVGA